MEQKLKVKNYISYPLLPLYVSFVFSTLIMDLLYFYYLYKYGGLQK